MANYHAFVCFINLSPLCLLRGCRAKIATRTPPENGGTGEFKITTATNHATRETKLKHRDRENQTSGFTRGFSPPNQFEASAGQFFIFSLLLHTESNGYVRLAAFRKFILGLGMVRKSTIRSSNFQRFWREILQLGIWLRWLSLLEM